MAVFAGLADVLAREPPGSVLDLADRLDARHRLGVRGGHMEVRPLAEHWSGDGAAA